jgi:hypothetical protein
MAHLVGLEATDACRLPIPDRACPPFPPWGWDGRVTAHPILNVAPHQGHFVGEQFNVDHPSLLIFVPAGSLDLPPNLNGAIRVRLARF